MITNAAAGTPGVKALVYVNAFAPDAGESATQLAGPDSALSVPDPTTVFDSSPGPSAHRGDRPVPEDADRPDVVRERAEPR